MDADERTWRARVELALLTGDGAALRTLHDEGTVLYGADAAQRWARVLSAFDASAVTG